MKFILYVENDAGDTLTKQEAPTFEMLEERFGEWDRNEERRREKAITNEIENADL